MEIVGCGDVMKCVVIRVKDLGKFMNQGKLINIYQPDIYMIFWQEG